MKSCFVPSLPYLAQEGLELQSIKCYLSALRHAQIANGFPDPQIGLDHSRLECILRGTKRSQASASSSCTRLPIIPEILRLIHSHIPSSPDSCMIWAACCLGFFGFLHVGGIYGPFGSWIQPRGSPVSCRCSPWSQLIRQSKTDPFRLGVDIYLGKAPPPLCPILAIVTYIASRGPQPSPLFFFNNGSSLSWQP